MRPRLVRGDMLGTLPALLSTVDSSVVPLVFASTVLTYLTGEAAHELVALLVATGARRDLVVVLNEAAICGVRLFGPPAPDGPATQAIGTLGVDVPGHTGPHGQWLTWAPARYPVGCEA